MKSYQDIINVSYPYPSVHKKMSLESRSAQFSPFKAMVGYDLEIMDSDKVFDKKINLTEDEKLIINDVLKKISISKEISVSITFFVSEKNDLGYYNKMITQVKKVDFYNRYIILVNNKKVDFDDICSLEIID